MVDPDRSASRGQYAWCYGLRAWSEQGYQSTKRAGWQWQRTHRTQPEQAARRWRAVAVATLWLLRVGGEAEETIPVSTASDVTALEADVHADRL